MGELSAGGYRATGRPFYNHLIGVASITAMETRDVDLISAALLHSSYEFGRFSGWLFPPRLKTRREIVANRVGSHIETIIYRYHTADWRHYLDTEKTPLLSADEKNILLLKLSDMLEDFIEEKGPIGTQKNALWPLPKTDNSVDQIIRISDGIGAEKISTAFKELSAQPARVMIERATSKTFFYAPLRSVIPYHIKSALRRLRQR